MGKNGCNVREYVVFTTLLQPPRHRPSVPLILQLGTNSPETSLAAARHVLGDVDGIDVNLGCPKKFSVSGGMGCALLKNPKQLEAILTALVNGIDKPVTCKMRILPDFEASLQLLKLVASCGVAAVAVHPRTPTDRTETVPADYSTLKRLLHEAQLQIPVILSGDVFALERIPKTLEDSGTHSVMIARAALWNVSIFSPEPISQMEYGREFLWASIYYKNCLANIKYTLTRAFEGRDKLAFHAQLQASKTLEDFGRCFGCDATTIASFHTTPPDLTVHRPDTAKRRKVEPAPH
eukprot:NODE_2419_length_1183_cov_60.321023_g2304_i0.p1 GENE.NODE_2419_length_1183_cov_60.321023_g2304_i0~~NODE_2419_length_1183_cov_60.321023_g2304_i0.p1  ORF type:complete len:293 (+),score=79.51 NODE_2419_length_1183_cov_60.321023_g2304_i0:232-1110(+)